MSLVMMQLGGYQFGLETSAYQSFTRVSEWRWPAQERIGRQPARQFIGAGNESVELEGIIYPHFKGGLGQLERMRSEAEKGKPLLLVDGLGKVWGDFVIESIEEKGSEFFSAGVPQKIEFSLSLARYGR
jgi:hypothetical protein